MFKSEMQNPGLILMKGLDISPGKYPIEIEESR
jgi:hypothetical protein